MRAVPAQSYNTWKWPNMQCRSPPIPLPDYFQTFVVPRKQTNWYITRLQTADDLRNRYAKTLAKLFENLGSDLVAAVAVDSPQKAHLIVVLE